MSDSELAPRLRPTDRVRFVESHRPPLDDGDYRVTVTHALEAWGFKAERHLDFTIAGPRFALPPNEITGRFPPAGSSGDFARVLPHVLLERATLPWERSAIPEDAADAPPWLALLVFAEEEIRGRVRIAKAEDLLAASPRRPTARASFAKLHHGSADDPKAPVTLLELPAGLADTLLPTAAELALLCCTRDVNERRTRALVVANRLPIPGRRNIAHLVSLERQYLADAGAKGDWRETHRHWAAGRSSGTVEVISLASWSFDCEPAHPDLGAILAAVDPGPLALAVAGLETTAAAVGTGAVPVELRQATGGRTAGWYHGPLAARPPAPALELPVRRAADLLLGETATGLTDLSYAAAWELGRLLALADPLVGARLYQWKRQVAHAGHAALAMATAPEAMTETPTCPVFELRDWFETELALLGAVPYAYLVPEPGLLPEESLRHFVLDKAWLEALLDGAFSIGRTSRGELAADAVRRRAPPPLRERSGLLLRSAAVAGWPQLEVDGHGPGGEPVEAIRRVKLAPDTLLMLFEGIVAAVDVHLHPQAMHFGVEADAAGKLTKHGHGVDRRGDASSALDIAGLAEALKASRGHTFSRQMIEGVPKVTYRWSVG
jgi:hypothetical protein